MTCCAKAAADGSGRRAPCSRIRRHRLGDQQTASGIITLNLWATAEGAAAFSQNQEARHAQHASGLPAPATFECFPDAEYTLYPTNDSGI